MKQMDHPRSDTDWKALQYFNVYRVVIALFFLILVLTRYLPEPLGEHNLALFRILCFAYTVFAAITLFLSQARILPHQTTVILSVVIDIVILTMMMYASGGLRSGFGLLLVISVASGSILSTRKLAIFIAAVASLVILAMQLYVHFFESASSETYTQSAILGLAFFITSFSGNFLSSRLRVSEALAESRAIDLQNLAKLNEQIIDRMQSGIIAVDNDFTIRLMNNSARQLLNLTHDDIPGRLLAEIKPELVRHVIDWQENKQSSSTLVRLEENNTELRFGVAEIANQSDELETNTRLIFLEDASKVRQQAQSIKLESLGRLAAGIAHEVRNPLGAISHAGQLLTESTELSASDARLTEIIQTQSERVNNIIENVMDISRRRLPNIEDIALTPWLQRFEKEFIEHQSLITDDISIDIQPDSLTVSFDTTQLHQVIWNLCQNAVRHSQGKPMVTIWCGISQSNQRPYMDIIDTGNGIDKAQVQQLFEPFFTTEQEGTGLGLYIARELCEINQASLGLQENSEQGCCFRILFHYRDIGIK